MIRFFSLLFFLSFGFYGFSQNRVSIISDSKSAPVQFGLHQISESLKSKKFSVDDRKSGENKWIISAKIVSSNKISSKKKSSSDTDLQASPESFSIKKEIKKGKQTVHLTGSDETGLMYALLEISEKIAQSNSTDIFSEIKDVSEKPYIKERAVSTYTMQRKYWETRLYDENYWKAYFDLLAKSRFNMFTLIFGYENGGFLAPCYPYFFEVGNFPEVKLAGLSKTQQQKNLAAMRRIIQLAHNRGIKITLGIWDHIFRGGIQLGDMGNGANIDPAKNVIVTGLNSAIALIYQDNNKLQGKKNGTNLSFLDLSQEVNLLVPNSNPLLKNPRWLNQLKDRSYPHDLDAEDETTTISYTVQTIDLLPP